MNKKDSRLRRARSTRIKLNELRKVRLCVYKTSQHTYAQIISSDGDKVLASASTLEKSIKSQCSHGANISSAETIGRIIAERALEKLLFMGFRDLQRFCVQKLTL